MSRDADCRMKLNLKLLQVFLKISPFKSIEFSSRENYFIMQMANPGSCQSHSRATLHVPNEYLILEVCHSNFKFKNNKKRRRMENFFGGIVWDSEG
jgi:hypothetical protein